jgi:uncharacterized protein
MFRKITADLIRWFQQADRKPLVLRGARQVGKTWIVRDFAKTTNLQLIEINFERDSRAQNLFEENDPKKVMLRMEAYFGSKIAPENVLLFLDEIQAAKGLLAKLRWFAEEMPQLAIIATGSLLDFVLQENDTSVPVGRIQYLYLEPLSFEEFLLAVGQEQLLNYISNYHLSEAIPDVLHNRLQQLLREYIFIGGLPAVVGDWVQNQSFMQISERQQNLITTYKEDFAKYARHSTHARLEEVFNNIPRLMGKKFKYSAINRDLPSIVIKHALNLLSKARICHQVFSCSGEGIPLGAGIKETVFKVIFIDVGLASAVLGIGASLLRVEGSRLANEGGIAEQLGGQLLRSTFLKFIDPQLFYWVREKAGSEAEIDYLLQHNAQIIPIEVKAGSTGTLRSLHNFMKQKKLTMAVRINADYPSIVPIKVRDSSYQEVNYQLLSLPFYLLGQIHRLLDEAV